MQKSTPAPETIRDRVIERLSRRDHLLEARHPLASELSDARHYLDEAESITHALKALYFRIQSAETGDWETLLTDAVRAVIPGAEQTVIRLRSAFAYGKPTLDVLAVTDGREESIIKQRGGSLANVVAAALRYIVVLQSANRRFIAFDEPDCWLSDANIGAFYGLVGRMARDCGIQTLLITHRGQKDAQSNGANVIDIARDDNVSAVSSTAFPWQENEMGMRHIELHGFELHERSKIYLAPGLNMLSGDNEVGKSTVLRALRVVARNSAEKEQVRVGQNEFHINIAIENSCLLSYEYSGLTGKTRYLLKADDGSVLLDSGQLDPLTNPPAFVTEVLGFAGMDSACDIHFSDQLNPLFVLSPTIDSRQRAELLSLSGPSQVVHRMQVAHKKRIDLARATLRRVEPQLTIIDRELELLRPISGLEHLLNTIHEKTETEKECSKKLTEIDGAYSQIRIKQQQLKSLNEAVDKMNALALAGVKETAVVLDNQSLRLHEADLQLRSVYLRGAAMQAAILEFSKIPLSIAIHALKSHDTSLLDSVDKSERHVEYLSAMHNQLKPILNLISVSRKEWEKSSETYTSLAAVVTQIEKCKSAANEVVKQTTSCDAELEAARQHVATLPRCKSCGQYQPNERHFH